MNVHPVRDRKTNPRRNDDAATATDKKVHTGAETRAGSGAPDGSGTPADDATRADPKANARPETHAGPGPEGIDYSVAGSGNDVHWYDADLTMRHYVGRYLARLRDWGEPRLRAVAEYAAGDMDRRARHTDREGRPRLIRYDKSGRDVSDIWYNEGYLATVAAGYGSGVVGLRYNPQDPGTGPVAEAVRRA